MAFGRVVQLLVGKFEKGNESSGETVLDLSQFEMIFDVIRSVEWYDNGAEITIYNPSPDTLNTILNEGNSVILKAGYADEGGAKTIFAGQIASEHNLAFYLDLVREARKHIKAGDFKAWKDETVRRITTRL